ncbi:TPA_asm: hypothetical protein [Phelipanche aegyptiaca amalgavirus 1]|nr:TPA_asm: hypothetical protein [Phelipanche aegyptiaca amalgavirus 1]
MAQQTYQPKPAINVEVALAEAFQPLARCGFPVEAWTPAVVLRTYVPIAKFIDTIKILSKEGDEGMMDAMVQQGGTLNYWTLVASATPLQLYKFCQWLRSDAGIKFTVDRRRRRALEKKVVGAQSLTDVGMVSGLIAQSNELAILRKQTRSAAEELMTELRRQLNLARDKLEADLRALEADYSPASQYVPMDDAELGQACWSLYEADCAARDRQPDELTNALLDDVRVVYGGQATANHQTQFMQDQSRRNDLKVWLEEKVLELESVGDSRQASSFRSYLESSGGGVADEIRAEVEARAVAAGSIRRDRRKRRQEVDPANIISGPRQKRLEAGHQRDQEQTATQRGGRGGGGGTVIPGQQHPVVDLDPAQGDEGGSDPHRKE